MRLPGTRYQEHGWEQVRKLLGRCSLEAFARTDPALLLDDAQQAAQLALYVDLVAEYLHRASRAEAPGNSYGESVVELAMSLLYELQERPADWTAFCAAVAADHARSGRFWEQPGGDAMLRKKVNDMYSVLRDKVDADNYQVACGRPCSANRIYTYRMLDTAYGAIAAIFADWENRRAQLGAILGREIDALPIEVRQMKSIAGCKADWVIRWSASQEQFGDGPGPLHTRSKRFASLKNSPQRIADMLAEIGDYEELSSNRDQDWLHDAGDAGGWLEDLWRVLEAAPGEEADQLLPGEDEAPVSAAPRCMQLANIADLLAGESLPVRLALYLKILGGADESYPDEWLDRATGELPTMAQLAAQAEVSLPTLRKRRDAAIAALKGMDDDN
jgi:hypothetical protein